MKKELIERKRRIIKHGNYTLYSRKINQKFSVLIKFNKK